MAVRDMPERNPATDRRVYLVGARYHHHASHSGYENFGRYVGTMLKPPGNFREAVAWKPGRRQWPFRDVVRRIDTGIGVAVGRPGYSLGVLFAESAAALHMLRHRNSLYHVLYGDTDLWLLGHVSRMTGHFLIATFHQAPLGMELLAVNRQLTERLDAVVLVSESQRRHFEGWLPPERIHVVPHGIDTEFFHPARELSAQPVLITAGAHWRDFWTLKQAMDVIWQANPAVHLVAVGTRGFKDVKQDLGLYFDDKRVRFLDGVGDEELLRAYQGSRTAVLSFWDATASNALLEALACGLPVVATDVGGVREYLGDEAGVVCPRLDPQALAAAVLRVLDDPPCALKMAAASRARALDYDYRVVAGRLSRVYAEILGRREPSHASTTEHRPGREGST